MDFCIRKKKPSVKIKLLSVIMCLVLVMSMAKAQSQENKIQAIFVLKFVENVSWPKEKKGLIIGVVGSTEVFTELYDRLKLKNTDGFVIKKINPSAAGSCDVVFLSSSKDDHLLSIIESIQNKSILLITESDLARKGAGISFQKESGKLQFLINKNEVESRGLKIAMALLSLGSQV
jgi:hypothetical protein